MPFYVTKFFKSLGKTNLRFEIRLLWNIRKKKKKKKKNINADTYKIP